MAFYGTERAIMKLPVIHNEGIMFVAERNLGVIDFAVTRAIPELQEEYDLINAKLIAEHIGCEQTAVYRSMSRLREAGRLRRGRGAARRGGYRYIVC